MSFSASFSIMPYAGVDGIRFGAAPSEVLRVWGPAERQRPTRLGELEETRGAVFARYASDKLVEVSFGKMACVTFGGVDLLHDPRALDTLLSHDPVPYELHGFLVFFQLGIALTGVHDNNSSQLAVTAFVEGRWDAFRKKMVEWRETERGHS